MNSKTVSLFIIFALMTIIYSIPKYINDIVIETVSASENKVQKSIITQASKSKLSQLVILNSFTERKELLWTIKKDRINRVVKKPKVAVKVTPSFRRQQIHGSTVPNTIQKVQKEKKPRLNIVKKVSKTKLSSLVLKNSLKEKTKTKNITSEIKTLQIILDELPLDIKKVENNKVPFKTKTTISKNLAKYKSRKQLSQSKVLAEKSQKKVIKDTIQASDKFVTPVGYWDTVHSIESKQGKLLYRPRNKARNCSHTSGPCGHHQLTVQALKDIGCNNLQCRKDRLIYEKSLQLSKKLLALNEKRLKRHGLVNLEGHERYLIHQQGANGIKNIIAATKGRKELSKTIKKNMANNSPYSYKQLKRMGSKNAANKFLNHWKHKWASEQRLVLASTSKTTNRLENTRVLPSFDDKEISFALNMTF